VIRHEAPVLTREAAAAELRKLAAAVREPDAGAAAARLLERIAEVRPELRDALVEEGARAVVKESRR
jgi:hypothetical protein